MWWFIWGIYFVLLIMTSSRANKYPHPADQKAYLDMNGSLFGIIAFVLIVIWLTHL